MITEFNIHFANDLIIINLILFCKELPFDKAKDVCPLYHKIFLKCSHRRNVEEIVHVKRSFKLILSYA